MMLDNRILFLTRSPYLFIAIVNGLMPMKNLWLLSSIIRLFSSQMILLCTSFCKEQHAAATPSHHFVFSPLNVAVVGVRCRNASHILIIVDAVPALPDLPLIQDQLVRVRDHWLWAEQQDGQQSCSQQGADMLPCRSTTAKVHHYSTHTPQFTLTTFSLTVGKTFRHCVEVVLDAYHKVLHPSVYEKVQLMPSDWPCMFQKNVKLM